MKCPVCPSVDFTACEYRTDTFTAPALTCAKCGALTLDESAARSFEERRAIREAIAIRAGIAKRDTGRRHEGASAASTKTVLSAKEGT